MNTGHEKAYFSVMSTVSHISSLGYTKRHEESCLFCMIHVSELFYSSTTKASSTSLISLANPVALTDSSGNTSLIEGILIYMLSGTISAWGSISIEIFSESFLTYSIDSILFNASLRFSSSSRHFALSSAKSFFTSSL